MTQAARLKLRQTQQLNQQQQHSLRILHMSAQELAAEVENWLQDNPLLERPEHEPSGGSEPEIRYSATLPDARKTDGGEGDIWETLADENDFRQQLHAQVCEHPLSPDQAALVHLLIDNLDEQGYLKDKLEDIIDHAPLEWLLEEESLTEALRLLQNFDPPGIGAADLGECLLLQLSRHEADETVFCAIQLVKGYLNELGKSTLTQQFRKKFPQYGNHTVEAAQQLITRLNPFPAYGNSGDSHTEYIEPEVWIRPDPETGRWQCGLYRQTRTDIRLNAEYCELLADKTIEAPELKHKLHEAKTLLFSLEQRKSTVQRLAELILDRQADFFQFGTIGLVPLTIKETAAELGLAESTVSRAVNQKYLSCPQGIFPLRYFFSQAATYADQDSDQGISAHAIKAMIDAIIGSEDKTCPLSDQAITDRLALQGMNLARRTVSKYREELNLPPAHQRRRKNKPQPENTAADPTKETG